MKAKQIRSIEVVEIATGEVVHRVSVEGKTDTQIDRVDMGLLRNMDLERFSTRYSPQALPRKP